MYRSSLFTKLLASCSNKSVTNSVNKCIRDAGEESEACIISSSDYENLKLRKRGRKERRQAACGRSLSRNAYVIGDIR